MRDHDKAEWSGDKISMLAHYDWPKPHDKQYELHRCDPTSADCSYWIAADGVCYGLRCFDGQSCIAIVEKMVQSAGAKLTYVIFANKNRAAFKAWEKKWSKRTSVETVNPFDASVRMAVNA